MSWGNQTDRYWWGEAKDMLAPMGRGGGPPEPLLVRPGSRYTRMLLSIRKVNVEVHRLILKDYEQ